MDGMRAWTLAFGFLLLAASLSAQEILVFRGHSDGRFETPVGDEGMLVSGTGSRFFRWGEETRRRQGINQLEFRGMDFVARPGEPFPIGQLTYFNGDTRPGTNAKGLTLRIRLTFDNGATATFPLSLNLISTPNRRTHYENADIVEILNKAGDNVVRVSGQDYTLRLTFGETTQEGYSIVNRFHVFEGFSAQAQIHAELLAYEAPPIELPEPPAPELPRKVDDYAPLEGKRLDEALPEQVEFPDVHLQPEPQEPPEPEPQWGVPPYEEPPAHGAPQGLESAVVTAQFQDAPSVSRLMSPENPSPEEGLEQVFLGRTSTKVAGAPSRLNAFATCEAPHDPAPGALELLEPEMAYDDTAMANEASSALEGVLESDLGPEEALAFEEGEVVVLETESVTEDSSAGKLLVGVLSTYLPTGEVRVDRAVNVRFFGQVGFTYQVQVSLDEVHWEDYGPAIEGQGEEVSFYQRIEDTRIHRYRVKAQAQR